VLEQMRTGEVLPTPSPALTTTACKEATMAENSIAHAEQWRDIPGADAGYQASNFGCVRSPDRLIRVHRKTRTGSASEYDLDVTGKILTPTIINGYCSVSVMEGGIPRTRYVHRLVLSAFAGECPTDMECCHGDGNRQNNHLTNLRWDTSRANHQDRVKHGTCRGCPPKLTPDQKHWVRSHTYRHGLYTTLARDLGVCLSTISRVYRDAR